MCKILNSLLAVLVLKFAFASAPPEVLFLIASQDTSYHRPFAAQLRQNIIDQSHSILSDYVINVQILHEIFNHPGDWTVLTALPHLLKGKLLSLSQRIMNDNTKWIILCEDSTHVNLGPLLDKLTQENHTEALYLGHPLYDHEATIIHHFAFFENPRWFPYPMLRAGVVFTPTLLERVTSLVADKSRPRPSHTEFSIDAAHELARFIWDNVRNVGSDRRLEEPNGDGVVAMGHGHGDTNRISSHASHETKQQKQRQTKHFENVRKMILKRASYICPAAKVLRSHKGNEEEACVMYAQPMNSSACLPVKRQQIYFAIKTCHKFHKERIPIIEATWAPYAIHKAYFSDVADAEIPTISTGVPNVEAGHCAKTLAILKLALENIERMNRHLRAEYVIRWLFLSDDDTLLSVSGLCDLLGCFDPSEEIYLGERYGYRLHAADGFNYITGGGGIVLSLPTVRLLVQQCSCPSSNAPDDMILGSCLNSLAVTAIHSARFHQARPKDYSSELLQIDRPISFHKFWQLDPLSVYEEWFAPADRRLERLENSAQMPLKMKVQCSTNNESQKSSKLLNYCRKSETMHINSFESKLIPYPVIHEPAHHAREKHSEL